MEGRPRRLSENPDHADAWDIDAETINYPIRVMDQWRKNNPEPPPGTMPRVIYQPTIRPDQR